MSYQIAICGAGIGGLAAAALLADKGHKVTVFDQLKTPAPVGSGLVIQPVGQMVLDALGAGDAARAKGNPVWRMLGIEATSGRRMLDVSYDVQGGPRFGLAIHRASLFRALLDAAMTRDLTLVSDAQVMGVDGGTVRLANRDMGPFDLIVDAMGVNSVMSDMQVSPLPYGAIWGTVDWVDTDLPRGQLSQSYRRADRMIGVMPCGSLPGETTEKAAIFWSLPRDAHQIWLDAGLDAWKAEAHDLWPRAAPFLAQLKKPDQMTMARYGHGTMRRPFHGKVVHIGDAARRASP